MSEKKEYIERGALIAFVSKVRKNLPKDSKDFFTRDEMLLNFQQYVDAQPAADVEPVVRGEWKLLVSKWDRETDILLPPRNECSVCKNWIDSFKDYDFCPFCGANMTERSGSGE